LWCLAVSRISHFHLKKHMIAFSRLDSVFSIAVYGPSTCVAQIVELIWWFRHIVSWPFQFCSNRSVTPFKCLICTQIQMSDCDWFWLRRRPRAELELVHLDQVRVLWWPSCSTFHSIRLWIDQFRNHPHCPKFLGLCFSLRYWWRFRSLIFFDVSSFIKFSFWIESRVLLNGALTFAIRVKITLEVRWLRDRPHSITGSVVEWIAE
jgi:hypothetical protein